MSAYSDKDVRAIARRSAQAALDEEVAAKRCVVLKGDDGKTVAALVSRTAWHAAGVLAHLEATALRTERAARDRSKR